MRTLTGMLAPMLMLMVVALEAQGEPGSKSLFKPCAAELTPAELESARAQLSDRSQDSARCLRLTRNEFVILKGGDIGTRIFHFCDARRVPACEWEPFSPYSFDVEREFSGANGKWFMLWKTFRYRQGVYDHGYGIFSLVPRSVEPRGFAIYPLASGTLFRGEDPSTSDPCQGLGDEVNEITGYELAGEGTAEVELRFTERIVNCRTREETQRVNRYRPRHGKFELLP